MNTIHAQLKREHREQRLFAKLQAAKEQRARYLARGEKQILVSFADEEIQKIEFKIQRHMEALRQ